MNEGTETACPGSELKFVGRNLLGLFDSGVKLGSGVVGGELQEIFGRKFRLDHQFRHRAVARRG